MTGTKLQMQLLQARFQKLNACSPCFSSFILFSQIELILRCQIQKLVKRFSWEMGQSILISIVATWDIFNRL